MKAVGQESRTISEQAAYWLCVLEEADPEDEAAFIAWLRKSPGHIEEFLLASAAWQGLRQLGGGEATTLDAVLAELGSARNDANVVRLPRPGEMNVSPASPARPAVQGKAASPKGVRWMAAAASLVAAAVLGWWAMYSSSVYGTAVGEQRTVRLSDGSVLYLNTASRARLRYSNKVRQIELLDGEALFVVARDSSRPFRVVAGSTLIQAVGTQFNVRRGKNDTRVSVIEGRVKVGQDDSASGQASSDGGSAEISSALDTLRRSLSATSLLDAGDEATIRGNGQIMRHVRGDVAQTVAWRERRIVFRAERLGDVIAEINRYGTRHFRIVGARARDTLLTATFDVDSPESLAAFLQRYSNLTVRADGDDFVIEDRAGSAVGR